MTHKLILIITSALFLSACNPADLFSALSTSELEQTAQEAVKNSSVIEAKLARIESKKKAFPQYIELARPETSPISQAVAFVFRNNFVSDQKMVIDIEAMLPDPKEQKYQARLVKDTVTEKILGDLEYRNLDDYTLIYESPEDLGEYQTVNIVLVSSEGNQSAVVLTGVFPTPTSAK